MKTTTIALTSALALAIGGNSMAAADDMTTSFGGFEINAEQIETINDAIVATGNVELAKDDLVLKAQQVMLTKKNGKVLVTLKNSAEPDM